MTVPNFYIVADGNAYAMDDDGYIFGAPVNTDGSIDWECAYDFAPNEEDVEYVAYMCNMLLDMQSLTNEHHNEVFVK